MDDAHEILNACGVRDLSSVTGRREFLSDNWETLESVVTIYGYAQKIPFADKMEWVQEFYTRLLSEGGYLERYDQSRPLRPYLLTIFGRILANILNEDPTRVYKAAENTVEVTTVTDADGTREYRKWKPGRSAAELHTVTEILGRGAAPAAWEEDHETRVNERMTELDRSILDEIGQLTRENLGESYEQVFYLTRVERTNEGVAEALGLLPTEVQDMREIVLRFTRKIRINGEKLVDFRQAEYDRVYAEEKVRDINFAETCDRETTDGWKYRPCCGEVFVPRSGWEVSIPDDWRESDKDSLVTQLTPDRSEGYDPRYADMRDNEVSAVEIFDMMKAWSRLRNPWDWLKHARRRGEIRVIRTNGRTGNCIRYYYCRKSAEALVAREKVRLEAKLLEREASRLLREASEDLKNGNGRRTKTV